MPTGVYDHHKQRGRRGRRVPRVTLHCIDCATPREFGINGFKNPHSWIGFDNTGEAKYYRCRKCYQKSVTGVHRPKEVCDKISEAKQGVTFSEEHKSALSVAAINRDPREPGSIPPRSEEWKRKQSLAQSGRIMPEEVCQKISRTMAKKLREIGRKRGDYNTGWYVSDKFNAKIFYRSSFEKTALEIFEASEIVVFLKSESCVLAYKNVEGNIRHYVVDYHVQLDTGEELLVEVKPSSLLNEPINILKFQAAQDWVDHIGMYFCVLTENELIDVNSVETTLVEATLSDTAAPL